MPLILRVVRYQQHPPDQPFSVSLGPRGGTIGRAPGNDWVLPDPKRFVSSRHAAVYRQADGYHLTDTSANGVYLNGSPRSLGRGGSTRLVDGDQLVLGEYEIVVSELPDGFAEAAGPAHPLTATEGSDLPTSPGAGGGTDMFASTGAGTELQPKPLAPAPGQEPFVDIGQGGSPLDLYGPASPTSPQSEPPASFSDHVSLERQAFVPPATQSPAPAPATSTAPSPHVPDGIPENWDRTGTGHKALDPRAAGAAAQGHAPVSPAEPDRYEALTGASHDSQVDFDPLTAQNPQPGHAAQHAATDPYQSHQNQSHQTLASQATPTPGFTSGSAAAPLLRAAAVSGLDPQGPDATILLERAGAILVEATRGLAELLRARSEVKELVRAERTLYWQSSNPLKNLALKPEEALRALLDPANASSVDAGESVRQVADDLKSHELALIAGMQAAFRSLIKRFEPAALEHRLQRNNVLDRMLPATRKARNWDLYVENYEQIAAEIEDALREVLRDEFARAYDREVRAQRQFGPGGAHRGATRSAGFGIDD